jgi:hypothetical protein
VNLLKKLDIYELVADYVHDNNLPDGYELLIELDGRNICKAVVEHDEDIIEFKVIPVR